VLVAVPRRGPCHYARGKVDYTRYAQPRKDIGGLLVGRRLRCGTTVEAEVGEQYLLPRQSREAPCCAERQLAKARHSDMVEQRPYHRPEEGAQHTNESRFTARRL